MTKCSQQYPKRDRRRPGPLSATERARLFALAMTAVAAMTACGQAEAPKPAPATPAPSASSAASPVGRVIRLDPAFDQLVPATAAIEKIAGGFQFTEGPLWRPDGTLWFSDVMGNVVRSVKPDGTVRVLIDHAAGTPAAPPGSFIGPNGMIADTDGTVLLAIHWTHQIVRVAPDLKTTTLIDSFEGKRLNSPNDLVRRSDDTIYFTDPPYGLLQQDTDPAKAQRFNGVFMFAHGKATALVRDLTRPNGVAFSPDEKMLYVTNSDEAHKVIMRYDVAADGALSNGRVFHDATADKDPGLPDGIKLDERGNIYSAAPGGIRGY